MLRPIPRLINTFARVISFQYHNHSRFRDSARRLQEQWQPVVTRMRPARRRSSWTACPVPKRHPRLSVLIRPLQPAATPATVMVGTRSGSPGSSRPPTGASSMLAPWSCWPLLTLPLTRRDNTIDRETWNITIASLCDTTSRNG